MNGNGNEEGTDVTQPLSEQAIRIDQCKIVDVVILDLSVGSTVIGSDDVIKVWNILLS